MSSTICHMQLQVGYNLFYGTMPNALACGMCNWNLITNTNCKTGFSSNVRISKGFHFILFNIELKWILKIKWKQISETYQNHFRKKI